MIAFGSINKYKITMSGKFKRDVKLAKKRGCDMELIGTVVHNLANDIPLAPKYRDHQLGGSLSRFRECHITPDWLLIYEKTSSILILYLYATGTHSDILE